MLRNENHQISYMTPKATAGEKRSSRPTVDRARHSSAVAARPAVILNWKPISNQMPRTLIFIVAYDASRHIESVIRRIPRACVNSDGYHILCIDDASTDDSARRARDAFVRFGVKNATVLRNPQNQGYGGNQKIGYRYAIDQGYDLVILLHGDGQYAPELLTRFVETFERTGADVILGSRMQKISRAAAGGMPFHKILGNRTLTRLQNLVTGRRLSEYHTGYRAYSVAFLATVPFEINTNDFHFDTEILLQAFNLGVGVEEFAIPTHYGDETCHVNGLRYALNVIAATVRFRMHQIGMLCSLKYRDLRADGYQDKSEMAYSSHAKAVEAVRDLRPKTLLDLGCGSGHVARVCERMDIRVTGIDHKEPTAGVLTRFVQWDFESLPLPVDAWDFDAVMMLDVIEHLSDPEGFLISLRNASKQAVTGRRTSKLVLTTPNVAFVAVRLNLLFGRFNYAERGILDITHKRLFTRASLLSALDDCGFVVERVEPVGVPFEAVVKGRAGRFLGAVFDRLARLWPTLFGFQFLVVCRPRPGIRQLLKESQPYLLDTEDGQVEPSFTP